MREKIKEIIEKLNSLSQKKPLRIISHHDTDGITSAAIFSRALQRWNKKFSLQIVKSLKEEFIDSLPDKEVLIFLDLASGSFPHLSKKDTEVIILDHHETTQDNIIPSNVTILNPLLLSEEPCSGAALAYKFARELSPLNIDLSSLAVVGMIGDFFDSSENNHLSEIIKESQINVKKGPLLYPATRPLDKVLEYSTSLYIPGVTGSFKGTLELLRSAKIEKTSNGMYKSLADLSEEEMSSLVTAIMLNRIGQDINTNIIGDIYLIKHLDNVEDARELSAMINACSRMGHSDIALSFCLGNRTAKKELDKIYTSYKQNIASALKYISESNKITGKNYTIINAQDKIKDTIIGTAASIMSFSPLYPEGTIIVAMAYDQDKIKVSARLAGRKGRNVREILTKAIIPIKGEVGGHPNAAGALIPKDSENEFIEELKKILDIDMIKIG